MVPSLVTRIAVGEQRQRLTGGRSGRRPREQLEVLLAEELVEDELVRGSRCESLNCCHHRSYATAWQHAMAGEHRHDGRAYPSVEGSPC